MEARLIDEITQIQATLGLDLLGPAKTASLAGASVEALGRLVDRHEWFALLYAGSLCTAAVRTAERPIRGRPRAGGEPNPRGTSGRRAAGGEAPDTTPAAADEVNWPIPLGRPVTHRFIRYEANDATRSTSNELMFIRSTSLSPRAPTLMGKALRSDGGWSRLSCMRWEGGISVLHAARL